jgi:undecaprenyl-diphosphatase
MSVAQALLLGVIQGLTEFLPVSSTAHLYIAQALLGISNDAVTLAFDIVLHLGTALALVLALGKDLLAILGEVFLGLAGRPARDPAARAVIVPLIVGTIPGVLAGLFLLKKVEAARTLGLIGLSMLVASVYFLYSEWRGERRARQERNLSTLSVADGLWIGLAQAAAGLMAGFSRSGFTIATGRVRGLARAEAARFSFLLALPIILGAGGKALLDLRKTPQPAVGGAALAAGFVAAAAVGFVTVKLLLRYLRRGTLKPFAVYLGVLGLVLLAVTLTRP